MKKGFTLIELLVVVLIIGILAAVALPQYRLAVLRTRFATLQPIVAALVRAQEVYYMENGTYATAFSDLSIDPPSGGSIRDDGYGGEIIDYNNFVCRLHSHSGGGMNVYCSGAEYGFYSVDVDIINGHKRYCKVQTTSSNAEIKERLCKSVGGVLSETSGDWVWYKLP